MKLNEVTRRRPQVQGWRAGKKDMTGRVVQDDDGEFWVDREDIDSGEELVQPGDAVYFRLAGGQYSRGRFSPPHPDDKVRGYIALVTDEARGRDDDVYKLGNVQG